MENLKELTPQELETINGGVVPEYDEDGNIISTCTDVPGFPFPGIG
ncbi:MAG: class IIb bacteriocin, lactobin A/cerein 7B family [Bacteroidota bacterium]